MLSMEGMEAREACATVSTQQVGWYTVQAEAYARACKRAY
jgi:hypothetical protein